MGLAVRVHKPVAYDPAVIEAVLGESPLPLRETDRVLAPFITINGRIHTPTSNFLRHHCMAKPNLKTAVRIASDLAGWLDFLINRRQLHPHEDSRDPAYVATEDDFAAYYRARQYGTGNPEEILTSGGWGKASSAIKRLYEYLSRQYQHTPPFQITTVGIPGQWTGTAIADYPPRRRSTGSAGTPLTPKFAQYLLMGALRIDLDGNQQVYAGADRDHATISLALATGLRRNNLANITTYELPRPTGLPFTTMRVADHITKGDAGGDAIVFTHYLPAVWNYVNSGRAELIARTTYQPADPLYIVEANEVRIRYRDPSRNPDEILAKGWTNCDEEFRRRLVNTDGSSPIVFLNELNGDPLAYNSLQHTVTGARNFVREHINPDFPGHMRLHDTRHTYAVHLAVAIYRDAIASSLPERRREDWQVDHIAAAVELVKFSLGHASEESTRLYIQSALRFLTIPIEQFLGET